MGLSFQEKSIWGTLAIIIVAYGYYCIQLFGGGAAETSQNVASLLVGLIVAIIVAEIVYHVAIAIPIARDEAELEQDERDKLIGWRAESWGGIVLGAFTITAIGYILFQDALSPPVDIMRVAHILIGGLVASEVVKCVMQLFLYRRGV